jgi:hypothetical protein
VFVCPISAITLRSGYVAASTSVMPAIRQWGEEVHFTLTSIAASRSVPPRMTDCRSRECWRPVANYSPARLTDLQLHTGAESGIGLVDRGIEPSNRYNAAWWHTVTVPGRLPGGTARRTPPPEGGPTPTGVPRPRLGQASELLGMTIQRAM